MAEQRGEAASPHESRFVAAGGNALKDTIAGLVASVVLIANIVSFGALMFPGELSAGIPTAIWAMLIGSSIGACASRSRHPCRRSQRVSIPQPALCSWY